MPRKVLWHSNAPWAPTGYGYQTALFAPKLTKHYDLWLSANYGLEGAPSNWKGIPVLPGFAQSHGDEAIMGHASALFDSPREGLIVTLYDPQALNPAVLERFNTACWVPVDHDPPPPAQIDFFRRSQAIPIAMSHYGEEKLAEFDPLYCPHGVDTEVFKPTPSEIREQMSLPEDAFLVSMVAANKGVPSRKHFVKALQAFAKFQRVHEHAYLYLHTTLSPEFAQGEALVTLLEALGIPEDHFRFPNQYQMVFSPIPPETMAKIYSTTDVLLNPAAGEGFGVPILEAQACGTPAIVCDHSAMSEVCGAGWKLDPGDGIWTRQASFMAEPRVEEIVASLEACHDMSEGKRKALSAQAVQHTSQYEVGKVFDEHMLPALREIEERIGDQAPLKVAA